MLDLLLVDDEPSIRLSLGDALRNAGHKVRTASDGAEALAAIASHVFDVVISDLRLPKADGLSLFRSVRKDTPGTEFILITAHGTVAEAVSALKEGVADFLTKPFDVALLLHGLERINRQKTLERELTDAREALASRPVSSSMVGRSPAMKRLLDRIETFAASDAPVLITGESGTGKELVARTLHTRSARNGKPFVAVNCAGTPETLIEAELFGHERGAFTGAIRKRDGRFKAAHEGTLFLDEIAEMSPAVQAKLLRVLQEGTFEPLGTNQSVSVDVRIVSATNKNLRDRVNAGLFRDDLYFRLNVLSVAVPPLRERRGDLPALADHFLRRFSANGTFSMTARARAALAEYSFPGNVRELEHAMQHAVVLAQGAEIDLPHLPAEIAGTVVTASPDERAPGFRHLCDAAREFEREYLARALRVSSGRKAEAAKLLGISRKNLWEKLRAHELKSHALKAGESAAAAGSGG